MTSTRRSAIVYACVAVTIAVWVGLVASADRENVVVNYPEIYGLIGASGVPEDCPDVTAPPSQAALEGARELARIAREQPTLTVPNPNPDFGATLPASNAVTAAAGSLRACIGSADGANPGWERVVAQLEG